MASHWNVHLWDWARKKESRVLGGHGQGAMAVKFTPDGRNLLIGTGDGFVFIWDVFDRNSEPIKLKGHTSHVNSILIDPKGKWFMSGGLDGTLRKWSLIDSPAAPKRVKGMTGTFSLTFSDDSQELISYPPGRRRIYSLTQDRIETTQWRTNRARYIERLWPVSNSPTIFTLEKIGPGAQTLHRYDLDSSSNEAISLNGLKLKRSTNLITISRDGQKLASGINRALRVWDLTQPQKQPKELEAGSRIEAIAFSYDGKLLAVSSDEGQRIWRIDKDSPAPIQLPGEAGEHLTFSRDNRWLASTLSDGHLIQVHDLNNSNSTPIRLRGHGDFIFTLEFAPKGDTLASGSQDKTILLWDLRNPGLAPIVLTGHRETPSMIAFSPDGRWLASGDPREILLWARAEVLAERVCDLVWRNLSMEEWRQFVGEDVPYESTCPNLPPGEGAPPEPTLNQ